MIRNISLFCIERVKMRNYDKITEKGGFISFYRMIFWSGCKINGLKPIILLYLGRFSFTGEKRGLENRCKFNVLKNVFIVALFLLIKIHIFERQPAEMTAVFLSYFSPLLAEMKRS